MFRIEMLPAGHGDSLLISYGDPTSPKHILIDGGPYYFFANKKKKELGKRQTLNRRLAELTQEGSELELMVVTHVDGDHIEAAIRWIGSHPQPIPVQEIWFNGRHHLDRGWMGIPEGEFLSKLIDSHGIPWNMHFEDGAGAVVCSSTEPVTRTLEGGMKLTVLSPSWPDLDKLRGEWDQVLEEEKLDTDDPQAILERLEQNKRLRPTPEAFGWLGGEEEEGVEDWAEAVFKEDATVANGSSIALLAEYEGKAVLLAGDAHPSTLIDSINQLLRQRGNSRLAIDAFKVPHHGSKNNLNRELLELVECRRFLISTNGSYFDHPDQEAIARILKYGTRVYSRNSFDRAILCFNYQKPRMKSWDDPDLKSTYLYDTDYPASSGDKLVIDL